MDQKLLDTLLAITSTEDLTHGEIVRKVLESGYPSTGKDFSAFVHRHVKALVREGAIVKEEHETRRLYKAAAAQGD